MVELRADPDRAALARDSFYDDPLLDAAHRYAASSEWTAVRSLLPPAGGVALDVGAGRGIAAFALAQAGWRVVALEPDAGAIVGTGAIGALARESRLAIDVVQRGGESMPFADASFDLVHCRAVLHHATDLGALCREIARVLRPGGRLIATREHVISRREDLPDFLASHPLHPLYGGECAYLLSEYTGAIRAAGLDLIDVVNPFASDINLFPHTRASLRLALASRVGLARIAAFVPHGLIGWLGRFARAPGRLYSFVAAKPDHRSVRARPSPHASAPERAP